MRTVIFTLGLLFSQILRIHWNLDLSEKADTIVTIVFFGAVILDLMEIILKGICVFNKKGE